MTKLLTRDDIIRATDIQVERVDMTPFGWGGHVFVRGQKAKERASFESYIAKAVGDSAEQNMARFRAKLLVDCVVDAEKDGKPIFSGESDVDVLNEKSAGALDYLYEVAQRLSGFRKADVDAMTKNLPGGQSDGSTTA